MSNVATAADWKPGKPNGCDACFIFFVWHLVPWVRHSCPKGLRAQKGKTNMHSRSDALPTLAP